MTSLIITGGNLDKCLLEKMINQNNYNIIAVDNGLRILDENKIKPNHIVGDFDTLDNTILNKYKNDKQIQIHKYNPIKDNTDTDIAIELAINLNSNEIIILGGIGSRIDHVLGNIHIMKKALDNNIPCKMIDTNNEILLTNKNIDLFKNSTDKKYVSLIPLTEKIENITLKGFKYELTNGELQIGTSLGISNEITEEKAEIIFDKGILIIIFSKD